MKCKSNADYREVFMNIDSKLEDKNLCLQAAYIHTDFERALFNSFKLEFRGHFQIKLCYFHMKKI